MGVVRCKLNWYEDKIIFSGKIKALEAIVVEVCNNYGMFQYNSLEEFKYLNEGNIKRRIESHIAWLKETENIYGTIYNLFKFDTKFIDYYGTLGSDKLDMEMLIDELDEIVSSETNGIYVITLNESSNIRIRDLVKHS